MAEICVTLSVAVQMAVDHHRAGNVAAAEYICQQVLAMDRHQGDALRLVSVLAESHSKRARELSDQGDSSGAEAEYCRAIELDPNNPQIQMELGKCLHFFRKPAAAIFTFSETIRRFPEFGDAYVARARVLVEHKLFDDAVRDQLQAIELLPGDCAAQLELARTLGMRGDTAGAEACCRRALELDQHSAAAWDCLGRAMQINGLFEEAALAFEKSLALEPRPATALLLGLMGQHAKGQKIAKLLAITEDFQAQATDRVSAGFAMGKMHDMADRCDDAFAAYDRANALVKDLAAQKGHRFLIDDLRSKVDAVIETFTPDFFRQRAGWGQQSDTPVFIVGMPRSGTSLVEQILASHSKVFGAGERFDIAMIRSRLASPEHDDSPRHWEQLTIEREAGAHVDMLARLSGGAERVIDKMPGNIMDLGLIATLFPGARVIFCERDARDTCLSCFFQLFGKNDLLFSYDITDCAKHLKQYARLKAHWRQVLPIQTLEVSYEKLVTDLESESRRMIEFLGLSWEPACLDFHKTQRPVTSSSFWQVRQPIYSRSVGRWKCYEKHLAPMLSVLRDDPAV